MKINWVIRFKNPVFWFQIGVAIFTPILVYFGVNWEEMVTWGKLLNLLSEAVQNPVVVISVILSVWNAVHDPTTPGLGDSKLVMGDESCE